MTQKTLYTLNIDNHVPEITQYTYPFLEHYARRIGANFEIIEKRRWPDYPPTYEKLQIFSRALHNDDEWSIYVDSDALLHPNLPDYTAMMEPGYVLHSDTDPALLRFDSDDYFRRDGRFLGSGNWFTISHRWCRDLWRPLTPENSMAGWPGWPLLGTARSPASSIAPADLTGREGRGGQGRRSRMDGYTIEQAIERIHPTVDEAAGGCNAEHLIDDFVLSHNIARFGLKLTTLTELDKRHNIPAAMVYHQYRRTTEQKLHGVTNDAGEKVEVGIIDVLAAWRIDVEGVNNINA